MNPLLSTTALIKQKPWLALLVLAALFTLFLASFFLLKAQPMKAMSCRPRTSAEFEARMVEESARVLYTPRDEKSSFSATVHFNLDEDLLADTMMTIESMTADLRAGNGLIYRGPYKKSILLRLGSELLDDGGLGVDSLSFRFFDRGSHEICIQEQDSDAQYWKPNANVYIDFLDHRELDPEIGTPIGYKVRVE